MTAQIEILDFAAKIALSEKVVGYTGTVATLISNVNWFHKLL